MALEHHVTSHPIDQEILKARRIPSVRAIVIPCPESLRRLQDILRRVNWMRARWNSWPRPMWPWRPR